MELKIFKYNELYFTEFKYKDINFDIETTNITEQELTDLLLSIIKQFYKVNQKDLLFQVIIYNIKRTIISKLLKGWHV